MSKRQIQIQGAPRLPKKQPPSSHRNLPRRRPPSSFIGRACQQPRAVAKRRPRHTRQHPTAQEESKVRRWLSAHKHAHPSTREKIESSMTGSREACATDLESPADIFNGQPARGRRRCRQSTPPRRPPTPSWCTRGTPPEGHAEARLEKRRTRVLNGSRKVQGGVKAGAGSRPHGRNSPGTAPLVPTSLYFFMCAN